eukprot:m.79098 g.79098  ORF g.79098 m.79098 type:complete len:180 (+) comp12557_c1_seq1:164-703(+)
MCGRHTSLHCISQKSCKSHLLYLSRMLSMAHLTQNPSNPARWVVFYPSYIDSSLSVSEGRRIPKEQGVWKPDVKELISLLRANAIQPMPKLEGKRYPRNFMQQGRLRYQLKNEDGSLTNPAIPNRKALFRLIASEILKLPDRIEADQKREKEIEKAIAAGTHVVPTARGKNKKIRKPKK